MSTSSVNPLSTSLAITTAQTTTEGSRSFASFSNPWLWRALFIVAALYFLARGPWRAIHDSGDFMMVFAAARCWVHGVNPYVAGNLIPTARAAGAQFSDAQFLGTPMVYLPPALLLLSPLALLPWALAKAMWLFCSLGAALYAAVVVMRMAKRWTLQVCSFLLAFAPLHTGISKGQPSVLTCALILASIVTPQPYIAGLLLGIAACIKPQLALGFLLLAIGLHQGRKLIAACITGLVISGAALAWMPPGSLSMLISNLSEVGSASGINGGSALNPYRFQLINIDALIPQALYGAAAVALVYAIIALVSAIAVARAADSRMAIAVVAAAVVLVGYHRFYDSQILWLGIPAMYLVGQQLKLLALRACYAVFLIPGQTMAATWLGPHTYGLGPLLLLRHETMACVLAWLIFAWIASTSASGTSVKSKF